MSIRKNKQKYEVMTGSDRHNNDMNSGAGEDAPLEEFPQEERELIRTIWEKSSQAKPEADLIPDMEVEQSLQAIHRRLDVDADKKHSGTSPEYAERKESFDWRWIAAAASVLLILGAGFFLIPQKVQVPYAETQTVSLPDGSEVTLNSGSELQYSRLFPYLNREVELNGEAFFSVREGEQPFEVQANGTTVRVTGTEFNVRSWGEEPGKQTEVTVAEGSIQFYPGNREHLSVSVTAGQLSRWQTELQKPTPPDSVSLDHILGWRNDIFAFNKKPLRLILRELERRFAIQIELEAQEFGNEDVTIYYVDPQNAENILQDICRINGLRYSKGAQGYRVYQ